MQQRGLIHPQMLERVRRNFYPSLCTIKSGTQTPDAWGQVQPAWSDMAGLIDLPCRIVARSTQERNTPAQVYVAATHHVALTGYYPSIREAMQAVVDGIPYNIEGVEWDGNRQMTRLFVRLVK